MLSDTKVQFWGLVVDAGQTSMSCEQDIVRGMRTTSTVSPFVSGETTFAAKYFAWNGKRILFSRCKISSGAARHFLSAFGLCLP
jgi:hypothetical protein